MEKVELPDALKILIADDEHVIADTLAVILRRNGFETVAVYDGQAAVENARLWKPHLLLSDVMMPGMNGIEVAVRVCKTLPDCRVLLFSGHAVSSDLLRDSRVLGHNFEVIKKPL